MEVRRSLKSQSGMTLVVTLLLALAVMVALDQFLWFLTSEYRMVHRTYSYDNALYLAEAGIEEGFAAINYGTNSWGANGWYSLNGSSDYTKTINNFSPLGSSSAIGCYVVNVYGVSSANPVIVCTGIVDATSSSIAGAGNTNISRIIRVILGTRSTFQWGLLSQGKISLSGNALIDSFDSSDQNYSDYDITKGYGTYDSSKRKDNGDVATNAGITNSISVGNADIYGHVSTGPGGTVSVGSGGFVGSLANHPSGVIQSDRVSSSMNVDLPAPTSPFTSGTTLPSTTVTGGGSTPVDYVADSISVSGNNTLTFASGYSRVYVSGNINVSGNASIVVAPGAKVEFYVTGDVNISGNGLANQDQRATSFQLYATESVSVKISGNGQLTAAVYAPQCDVTVSGNGDVIGSIVGKTITFSGNAVMHYDEALKNSSLGPSRGYSIVAWQEL